ncbi:MAG: PhzF family phenazine biosynthesis protein [Thermoplasmata archaeon]
MPVPIFVVDAFTDRPFRGNPAGVCLLDGPAPRAWMRSVAAEMKHAETAFLYREGPRYRLRWFSPTVEVELCGHATLAAAHVLFERGFLAPDETARFVTQSGELRVVRTSHGLELNFPTDPVRRVRAPAALVEGIPLPFTFVGRARFDFVVEVASPRQLRTLSPVFDALARVPGRGVVVTARSDRPKFHYLCRFFAPNYGVPEDPVTGSIQCSLGPYWSARLGRAELTGFQASPRGGVFHVRPEGRRVAIAGQAVTVLSGVLEGPGPPRADASTKRSLLGRA